MSSKQYKFINYVVPKGNWSVMVADQSKTRTVFARSEAGIVGSNPTQGIDVWCVYAYILCLGRGLATS
jgi:hypothetical protein